MNFDTILAVVTIPSAFVLMLCAAVSFCEMFYDDFCDWFEEHGIHKISFCLIVAAIIITTINIALIVVKYVN